MLLFSCSKISYNKYFSKKNHFFLRKIYNINLDPDPKWAKILDPDTNSMYLDLDNTGLNVK